MTNFKGAAAARAMMQIGRMRCSQVATARDRCPGSQEDLHHHGPIAATYGSLWHDGNGPGRSPTQVH